MQDPQGNYFRQIVDKSFNAILTLDTLARIRYANDSASKIFGLTVDELLGHDFIERCVPVRYRETERRQFDHFQATGNSELFGKILEIERTRKDGSEFWVEQSLCGLSVDGERWACVVIQDADARKRRELELQREASTDALTGLANRRRFQSSLESNLHRKLALAIVDIDRFKGVNDSLGHPVGDEAIQIVSQKIVEHFPSGICIARLGGDEFGILVEALSERDLLRKFEELRRSISEQCVFADSSITASIGIAVSITEDTPARELLTVADEAMYQSKSRGRNAVTLKTIPSGVP